MHDKDDHDWQQIREIADSFDELPNRTSIRSRVVTYLGADQPLSKNEQRILHKKTKKLKTHIKKEQRAHDTEIDRQVRCAFNDKR